MSFTNNLSSIVEESLKEVNRDSLRFYFEPGSLISEVKNDRKSKYPSMGRGHYILAGLAETGRIGIYYIGFVLSHFVYDSIF